MGTYTLGLAAGFHETAAALACDGEVVAAAEQERFSRVKFDSAFPADAIRFCLAQAGIRAEQVGHIGFYWVAANRLRSVVEGAALTSETETDLLLNAQYIGANLNQYKNCKEIPKLLAGMGFAGKYLELPHHLCHAASAFYPSGFGEAAILTVDGTGDDATTLFALGRERKITALDRIRPPHSIGYLYMAATTHLGFQRGSDEYRVMGLASYGKPRYLEKLRECVHLRPDGLFELRRKEWFCPPSPPVQYKLFSRQFMQEFIPPRLPDQPIEERHADFAASVQHLVEEILIHMARGVQARTGAKRLCMAGGVALNCVANHKVLENTDFEEIYIHPAANDPGCAYGAALYLYHEVLRGERATSRQTTSYLGPEYAPEEIEQAIRESGLPYRQEPDISLTAAEKIAAGGVVGWFQGRMEWGPRALGNRSILADPRRAEMKDVVNTRIKFREEFRPFAPAVAEEAAARYFGDSQLSPFMLLAVPVTELAKQAIPAVVHVDGTARVQTVNREQNARFHDLIRHLEAMSGVPVVLNTSFNVKGEPIVCSPADAIRCFMNTQLDYLCLGDFLVWKS